MKKCRICGIELTINNTYRSRFKKYDYICNDCSKKIHRTYYEENKLDIITRVNKWTEAHYEQKINSMRSWRMKLKTDIIFYYSNGSMRCVRCGFDDIRALTLDHISGCGKERRKIEHGFSFYKRLRDNGYPAGYQILCMNCQFIKRVINNE